MIAILCFVLFILCIIEYIDIQKRKNHSVGFTSKLTSQVIKGKNDAKA